MASILLLDDNKDMLQVLSETLEFHQHSVICGFNGHEGINHLNTCARLPDVIISDLKMPNMNGLEFLGALQRDALWSQIPVAIMSGETGDRSHILKAGADAFVLKPFHYQEIETLLQQLTQSTC
jgi:CheY-like chemotaxis protein